MREALCFSPLQMGCPRWAPTTGSSAFRRVQSGNRLCYHIFDWPFCLASVSTCCEPKCWPWPPSLAWSWGGWRLWLTWAVKPQDAYSSGSEWNGRAAGVSFDMADTFREKEEWWFSKRILPTFYEIPISIQNVKPCLPINFFAPYMLFSSSFSFFLCSSSFALLSSFFFFFGTVLQNSGLGFKKNFFSTLILRGLESIQRACKILGILKMYF